MSRDRDATEDALRDAAHDAFMAFRRGPECDHAIYTTRHAPETIRGLVARGSEATSSQGQGRDACVHRLFARPVETQTPLIAAAALVQCIVLQL